VTQPTARDVERAREYRPCTLYTGWECNGERVCSKHAAIAQALADERERAAQIAGQFISQWAREHPEDEDFSLVRPIMGIILQVMLDGYDKDDDEQPERVMAERVLKFLRDGATEAHRGMPNPPGYAIKIESAIRANGGGA
jgi:hypothetical protein